MRMIVSDFLPPLLFLVCAWLAQAEDAVSSLGPSALRLLETSSPRTLRRIERLRGRMPALRMTLWMTGALAQTALAIQVLSWGRRIRPTDGVWIGVALLLLGVPLFLCVLPAWMSGSAAVRYVRFSALPLCLLDGLLAPLPSMLQRGVESLLRRIGAKGPRTITEEEFLAGVQAGETQGVFKDELRAMVEGILGLETTQASEVMTPRVDLLGVPAEASPEEWLRIAKGARYRHLPVYRGSMDMIEGMLDLVRFLLDPRHDPVVAVEPPMFVAESACLRDLLVAFQKTGARCAVVLDEYGGTAGLITRGDILEEITEDVQGEYAPETSPIQALGDGSWLVDGRTSLEDLEDVLPFALSSVHADRISGWATEHGGRLLRIGESVEAQGCRATVRRMRKHRILQLQLECRADLPPAGESANRGGAA